MKQFISSIIVLFSLASCAGGKDASFSLENSTPFSIEEVYFQSWVAGVQGGGSGINFYITLTEGSDEVELVDVYFREKKEALKSNGGHLNQFIGYFKTKANRDFEMDGNPIKEAQNTLPDAFPFSLKENEAVISYKVEAELKYYKISNIQEKPVVAYPGVNKNNPY